MILALDPHVHRSYSSIATIVVVTRIGNISEASIVCRGGDFLRAVAGWCYCLEHMAKPDTPNFSIGGRIVFGLIAILVIVSLLRFFGIL
jgi:hypothetical protein